MGLLKRFDRALDRLLNLLITSLSSALLLIFTALIFFEVITRYFFGFSTGQISEYCIFLFVWLVFLMAGKVLREKKHINIGILSDYLITKGKFKRKVLLDIFISITFLVFSVIYIYLGILDVSVYKSAGFHSTLDNVPHYWIWHLALPVGSFFLFYYALRDLIKNIHYIVYRKDMDEK